MRHSKTIELSAGRLATVQEVRVRDGLRLIKNLGRIDFADLMGDKFGEVIGLLEDCLILPAGETFIDLGLADALKVIDALKEVNADFLELAMGRLPMLLSLIPSPISTGYAAASSSVDTPTSSTTDGDSSSPLPTNPADEGVSETDAGDDGHGDQAA